MPFHDIAGRVSEVRERIAAASARGGHGQQVTIIAVTKTHGPEAVRAAWSAGLYAVGENRVQEAVRKMTAVEVPVAWHLIGHLQRNKVSALEHFAVLHSLDSVRLAEAVNEYGVRRGCAVEVLMQVNVSGEASKGGIELAAVPVEAERLAGFTGLRVAGVMTMAPYGASDCELRRVFQGARTARDMLTSAGHPASELSMGMSNDFEVAVEEGATMVRLGTVLFGARS